MSAETDTVCRVCLVNNLNLYGVRNDQQLVFERITRKKYNKVGFPLTMCYICLSELRKCHRFMKTAIKSHKMLKHLYNDKNEFEIFTARPLYKLEIVTKNDPAIESSLEIKTDVEEEEIKTEYKEADNVEDNLNNKPNNKTCLNLVNGEVQSDCEKEQNSISSVPTASCPLTSVTDTSQINEITKSESNVNSKEIITTKITEDINKINENVMVIFASDDIYNMTASIMQHNVKIDSNDNPITVNAENSLRSASEISKSSCTLRQHMVSKDTCKRKPNKKKKSDQETKRYSCNDCTYKSKFKSYLIRHMVTHTGEKPFSCDLCGYRSSRKVDMAKHIKRRHTGKKTFLNLDNAVVQSDCEKEQNSISSVPTASSPLNSATDKSQINEVTKSESNVNNKEISSKNISEHINKINENVMVIFASDDVYNMTASIMQHNEKTDSNDNTITVNAENSLRSANEISKSPCTLRQHKVNKDTSKMKPNKKRKLDQETKRYSCNDCTYKSKFKSYLIRHMVTHTGEKPFSCDGSSRKLDLAKHIKRRHTGEKKTLQCDRCNYQCAHRGCLNRHMRTHTSEKRYSCELCEYKTSLKYHLARHMVTHKLGRLFSCELCEYVTGLEYNLTRHKKVHNGIVYSCDLCEYKTVLRFNLTRHVRNHTRGKPFTCEQCDFTCPRKCGLKKHLLTKHVNKKQK